MKPQLLRPPAVKPCQHFEARMVGALVAEQLRDGRWRYVVVYECPCGQRFSEAYIRNY